MNSNCRCNICGDTAVIYLNLEAVPPLQNRFFSTLEGARTFTETEARFIWCEICQHMSIEKNIKIEFDQHYDNRQTASPFVVSQYKKIVEDIEQQLPSRSACVIEIGCGRGELLQMLRDSGYNNLRGFDPAAPVATDMVSNKLWDGVAVDGVDLIIARHTIEEIPEPEAFIGFMAKSLNHNGRIYCEITNAPKLLSKGGVFSLYPECSNLFSALSLARLYAKNGVSVEKITSINEGEWLGVWGKKYVTTDVHGVADYLSGISEKIRCLPRPIVLWGAAGRGGNILSFLKLGLSDIEFVVDLNQAKQGLHIPPYGQTVISPDRILDIKPRTILVANRKYMGEITKAAPADCIVVAISDL